MKNFIQYNEELVNWRELEKAANAAHNAAFTQYIRNDGKYGSWGQGKQEGYDYLKLSFREKTDMEVSAAKIASMGFKVKKVGEKGKSTYVLPRKKDWF